MHFHALTQAYFLHAQINLLADMANRLFKHHVPGLVMEFDKYNHQIQSSKCSAKFVSETL